MKEALLRFAVVSFSGKLILNGVLGHFYASIKTLRRLNNMNTSIENIVFVHKVYLKEGFAIDRIGLSFLGQKKLLLF